MLFADFFRATMVIVKHVLTCKDPSPCARIAFQFDSFKKTETHRFPAGFTFPSGPRGRTSTFLHPRHPLPLQS